MKLRAQQTGDWRGGQWAYCVCFPGTGNIIAHGATPVEAKKKAWKCLENGWKRGTGTC